MQNSVPTSAQLPEIRQDLRLLEGKADESGAKTWLIYDALRQQYFQIDNQNFQFLSLWHLGTPEAIVKKLGLSQDAITKIEAFLVFLFTNSLTVSSPFNSSSYYREQQKKADRAYYTKIAHGYLFFKIGLIWPDRFLRSTVHLSNVFFHKAWWGVMGLLAIVAILLLLRQLDDFLAALAGFANLKGLLYFFLALGLSKIVHELGHAYAASRYGCRVSSMGVAFLLMFPVLFTDITDMWKLSDKRQRLVIVAAGVAAELMIAVFATLFWIFLPDGGARHAALLIATTSWLTSITINCNPLMRFDGYHFFADLVEIRNLQGRSFALGRWQLREWLFDLREPATEALDAGLSRLLRVYAFSCWIYRFFLFLGIAILLHAVVPKPFGTFVFMVEIGLLILVPVLNEMKEWTKRKQLIMRRRRYLLTVSILAFLLIIMGYPWQTRVRMPAMIEAAQVQEIFSPEVGTIEQIFVKNGDQVLSGETLFVLSSREIAPAIKEVREELSLVDLRLARIMVDRIDLEQKRILAQEREHLLSRLEGLKQRAANLEIKAPFSGQIVDLSPQLHKGRIVGYNLALATITSDHVVRARGYVSADDVDRIEAGAEAVFIPKAIDQLSLGGVLTSVSRMNAPVIALPELVSHHDGAIGVSPGDGPLIPLSGWYAVSMAISEPPRSSQPTQVGEIHVHGHPESLATKIFNRVAHVLIRETAY